jgi:uncharacterized protein (TIGR00661 family)
MRLLYACSELGLGHAARTIALGKRLEKRGHEVHFYSGGKAYQLLQREFKRVYPVTPVAWYENNSGIITSASLINILFPLPFFSSEEDKLKIKTSSAMETIHRYYDLRKHIRESPPDIVIADGDLNALRLAGRWRIPAVYITNLIRPSHGFNVLLTPGERLIEGYVKQCTKIIIPDNSLPYTVCEYNIGNLESVGIRNKTEFVGSFFDTSPTEGAEKHVYVPISGPFGTRAKLMQMLIPAFKELNLKSIISLGVVGKKKSVRIGNCEVHTWLSAQERQECMRNAKLVVFSGGHITCFETIKYAKPSICIPTQAEQLANATKLKDLKCSIVVRNKFQLKSAVREIEEKYQLFKTHIEALNKFSNKFNGLNHATEIIEAVRV